MTINCEEIIPLVKSFSLVLECDVIKNGMLRMATPFQYPNGGQIDLFLGRQQDLFQDWVLTDLGQTTAYLLNLHIRPWTTKKRKILISDICETLGVRQVGGEFQINLEKSEIKNLPDAMVRLSQSCIRVADLALTQRFAAVSPFKEEFEEYLDSVDLQYEPSIILPGQFGRDVEIDFKVHGQKAISLVHTLSSGNSSAAHQLSNELFSRWYDLSNYQDKFNFMTVYDSNNDVFREPDLARLGDRSAVFGFPAQQDQIHYALAA